MTVGVRAATALVLGLALALALASPALAHGGTTDFRSEVTGESPPSDQITASVVGGDSLLRLEVEPGTEVIVLGYEGEPFLRIGPDGTVETNRQSPAAYVSDTLDPQATIPEGVDAGADPVWREVGSGGTHTWHDHRIHWMGVNRPTRLVETDEGRLVFEWEVPLVVDGQPVSLVGRLFREDPVSSLPYVVGAVALGAGTFVVGRRRPLFAGWVAVAVAAVLATVVGWAEWTALPTGFRDTVLVVALPTAALLLSLATFAFRSRAMVVIAVLVAGAALVGWGLFRFDVFSDPVLSTPLAPVVDRVATAVVLAFSTAGAVLAAWSGELVPVRVGGQPSAPDASSAPQA